jgi:hypothetical protein
MREIEIERKREREIERKREREKERKREREKERKREREKEKKREREKERKRERENEIDSKINIRFSIFFERVYLLNSEINHLRGFYHDYRNTQFF